MKKEYLSIDEGNKTQIWKDGVSMLRSHSDQYCRVLGKKSKISFLLASFAWQARNHLPLLVFKAN